MTAPTPRETADHAELTRLAEAATDGVWNRYVSGAPEYKNVTHGLEVGEMGPLICGAFEREEDCRFVEAAQPSVVLSLLSEIAALRDDLPKTERDYSELRDSYDAVVAKLTIERGHGAKQSVRATQAERQRDELRKALERIAKMGGTCGQEAGMLTFTFASKIARQALADRGAD